MSIDKLNEIYRMILGIGEITDYVSECNLSTDFFEKSKFTLAREA